MQDLDYFLRWTFDFTDIGEHLLSPDALGFSENFEKKVLLAAEVVIETSFGGS
jgi:hypothetical protein